MIKQPPGHGLLIEELAPTDYVAGDGNLTGEVINPTGDWLPYVPVFEHQAPQFETNSCASHGTLNAFEGLHKLVFGTELNLSDRMVAKGSGTDPARGNSPQKVAEFFRKNWSVFEEDWSMDGAKSVTDYYKDIPDLLYSKASIVKGDNVFGYEAITNPTKLRLKEALTKGAVCISVALMPDENGVYYRPNGWRDSHWVWLLNIRPDGDYTIMDSYAPYIKQVRSDFVPEVAYRYALNEEIVDLISIFIRRLREILSTWKKPADVVVVPEKPVVKPRSKITEWALAIQHEEGGKPKDLNMVLHNPGNLKYTEYTKSLGGIRSKHPGLDGGTFCEFPTYELGLKALCQFLKDACTDKLRAYRGTTTLDQFTKTYANPPKAHPYAKNVARKLGVPVTIHIKELL